MTVKRIFFLASAFIAVIALVILVIIRERPGVLRVEISPEAGTYPATTSAIRMTFNREVSLAEVEGLFSSEPALEGSFTQEERSVTFQPDRPLIPGQSVTIRLRVGLIGGENFGGAEVSFTPRLPEVLLSSEGPSGESRLIRLMEDGTKNVVFSDDLEILSFTPTPDGEKIVLSIRTQGGKSEVIQISREGTGRKRLFSCDEADCQGLAISSEGAYLAYERREPAGSSSGLTRIYLYNFSTGENGPLFRDVTLTGHSPRWSSEGQQLGFVDNTALMIRVVDLASGEEYQLPSEMGEMGSFAPDGSELVYGEIRVVGTQFFPALLRASLSFAGGVETLTDDQQEDRSPAWSPDGETIAFSRKRLDRQTGFLGQLALYDLAADETKVITNDPERACLDFQWSPDGRTLLFTRYLIAGNAATPEIWLYQRDTGMLEQIATGGEGARWLP